MKKKKSSLSWKSVIAIIAVVFLSSYFDVGGYIYNQDRSLWEQAGWKSYKGEHVRRVKFLLWLGADPSYVGENGAARTSVLENAVEWSNFEIIDILMPLLPEEAHVSAMDYACRRGMNESVVYLNEKGIVPSQPIESKELRKRMPGVCFEGT